MELNIFPYRTELSIASLCGSLYSQNKQRLFLLKFYQPLCPLYKYVVYFVL
jgi:hypothetical protein